MSFKQINLFDDAENQEAAVNHEPRRLPGPRQADEGTGRMAAFLPGVRLEEAFPQMNKLDELRAQALNCSQCRLRSDCRQVVFGVGPESARLMLVGEGPGEEEDKSGLPFVGRAGQLLDRILEAAGFQREAVYIANVVKCRPPDNRLPNPDEVKICRNYLEAQIRIIKPSILVCLGSMAVRTVLDPGASISRIRGQWFARQGIKIIATFHPAALLRNESYKRPVWEDFKSIRDEYRKLVDGEPGK